MTHTPAEIAAGVAYRREAHVGRVTAWPELSGVEQIALIKAAMAIVRAHNELADTWIPIGEWTPERPEQMLGYASGIDHWDVIDRCRSGERWDWQGQTGQPSEYTHVQPLTRPKALGEKER